MGDDTDGHIDNLARFCNETTLCYITTDDTCDRHYEALQAMAAELASLKNQDNQPYHLVPLPLPKPILGPDGERLPASYANFIITNKLVFVPVYNDKHDTIACERIAGCFPQRTIIPIDSYALLTQYGSLHCASMQLPQLQESILS